MSEKIKETEEELSFSAAMVELERILRGVEAEETDIDRLGEELKRAAELLELCRSKIRRAEVEVTQIVQSLEDGSAEQSREGSDDALESADEDEESEGGNGEAELPF